MQYKKLLLIFLVSICETSSSNVLYKYQHQEDLDLYTIPIYELKEKVIHGDVKSKYLLALHKTKNSQEKEEGIKMLKELSADDVVDADYALYYLRKRININELTSKEALEYLIKGAEGGSSLSQLALANAYVNGEFGKEDLVKSHYWLEKSARQNNPEAMAYIVANYHMGIGVTKDDNKAFEWLMYAYNTLGRNYDKWGLLGEAYEQGIGTPINLARAYMCYDLEGTAGIEDKARIAPRMTPEQRAEGLRLSQEWQEKNHVYTMQSLGLTRQKDGSYQ